VVTAVAIYMSKSKKKGYRSNPSRRRSRSRGRGRRGGSGIEKYVPWALGAGAAYLILSPKAAPAGAAGAAPAQGGILSSIMNLFKPSPSGPTGAQSAAQIASASANPIANIFNSIFGSSSKPAPTTQGPTSSAPASDPFAANRSAQQAIDSYQGSSTDSGMVTSLDTVPAAPSGDMNMVMSLDE
jgi:hypothetical protein